MKSLFLKKPNLLIIIFLVLTVFLTYINTYNNQLISDDINAITNFPTIRSIEKSIKTFDVFNMLHALGYKIGTTNPAFYHFINIAFHALNTVLVYVLVLILPFYKDNEKIQFKRSLAVFVSLLFAVHPIQTEVVTWISGGSYAVSSFFNLLSLIFIMLLTTGQKTAKFGNILFFSLSVFFLLISVLSSRKSIFMPLLYLGFFFQNPVKPLLKRSNVKYYLPILLIFGLVTIYFTLNLLDAFKLRVEILNPKYMGENVFHNPFIQLPLAVSNYLKLLFIPVGLTLYHTPVATQFEFMLMVITTIITLILAFIFYKKSKILFFGILLFFIPLIPFILPVHVSWVVAERYIYQSTIGFFLIVCYLLIKLGEKLKVKELPIVIIITLSCIYIPLTLLRNEDWKSPDIFWQKTLEASPNDPQAHNNMGNYYVKHGNFNLAQIQFENAIVLKDGKYPDAIHNLANIYLVKNEATKAAVLFKKALSQDPNLFESRIQLAEIFINQKKYNEAKEQLTLAIKIRPNSSYAHNSLAFVLMEKGDKKNAILFLKKAISLDQNNEAAKRNLNLLEEKE